MTYEILKFVHVIGATVLFGTGAGIAFFMVMSNRSQDPRLIAHVAAIVVVADAVFTATAALLQPVTGTLLAWQAGYLIFKGWVGWSLLLYFFVGAFWLPVVYIQMRLKRLAETARDQGTALPEAYHRLYRIWLACGFPAFFAVITIIWLMIAKPGY